MSNYERIRQLMFIGNSLRQIHNSLINAVEAYKRAIPDEALQMEFSQNIGGAEDSIQMACETVVDSLHEALHGQLYLPVGKAETYPEPFSDLDDIPF